MIDKMKNMPLKNHDYRLLLPSPLGNILVLGSRTHIQQLKFADGEAEIRSETMAVNADWFEVCRLQLAEYFSGQRFHFDLPIELIGSEFQKQVWSALLTIPFAETASYQTIAKLIDNDKAVRAVASANANNPIWIIIPCHRIIGGDLALRGYAGGIERKARLLALEGHRFNKQDFSIMNAKTQVIQ